MNFGFIPNLSFSWDFGGAQRAAAGMSTPPIQRKEFFNFQLWGQPSFSVISWAIVTSEKIYTLCTMKELKRVFRPLSDLSLTLSNWSKYFEGSPEATDRAIYPAWSDGFFDFRAWEWPSFSVISWVVSASDKVWAPRASETALLPHRISESERRRSSSGLHFRPYVSKCPWHTGPRAFLSQLFPRYGHYCGPNWSSGKTGGSIVWDRRPIDWLDFCCYCHDIGYDTSDQAELLKADLAFLECLERPHMEPKGDASVAHLYKTMCIKGLLYVLIPYRTQLLKLQSDKPKI